MSITSSQVSGLLTFNVRTKLTLLFLTFGLVPALVIFAIFMAQQDDYRTAQTRPVLDAAVGIGDIIDRNLFERYGDVQAFGLNAAAVDSGNWMSPNQGNPLINAMNGYMTGYGIYKLMLLVDLQGNLLAVHTVDGGGNAIATESLYNQSFSGESWFESVLAGKFLNGSNGLTGTVVEQPAVSPLVAGIYGDDGYVMVFAAPVHDVMGNVTAVWANFATFDLVEEMVAGVYDRFAADGQTSTEITVLDPAGRIIVDYDPMVQGIKKHEDYKRNFKTIGKFNLAEKVPVAAAAVKGETGSKVAFHARKKINQAAGYAHTKGAYDYPGLGWSVLVRVPEEEAFASLDAVVTIIMVVMVVAAIAILVGGAFIGTMAAKPIISLTGVMQKLAEGDKTVEVPGTQATDELGDMSRTVEVFKENALKVDEMAEEQKKQEEKQKEADLRSEEEKREGMMKLADSFEERVGGVVNSVASSSGQMKTNAQAMSATAEETTRQSTAVAAAAEQASANVQTVASAAEELSSSIEEVGRQVTDSATIAKSAVEEAAKTNSSVEGLAAAAGKIGEVVELINDIASQTNLLALNATIEAACAGDAGKGFAVVANEVKSLANQTAKATDEIGSQIGEIQTATNDSVDAIKGISETIGKINEIATAIATAVEQQGAATKEISRNVQQASSGTQEVSSNISGVSAAAGETGENAGQVQTAAEQLTEQADTLRGEADNFLKEVRGT